MNDATTDRRPPNLVRLAAIAALGGAATGVVGAAFRRILEGAEQARAEVV
jgi:uncharacterized protein involved in exopolysaccharide biosynthesis